MSTVIQLQKSRHQYRTMMVLHTHALYNLKVHHDHWRFEPARRQSYFCLTKLDAMSMVITYNLWIWSQQKTLHTFTMASLTPAQVAANTLQLRIQYSSIAFLYFDYFLTFPSEVKYIWNRKVSLTTLLYYTCRYAMVANVLYVFVKTEKLGSSCNGILTFISVISCLGRAAVIATLTGRTYVIYGCNRLVLAFFAAMGITCVVLDFLDVPGTKCKGGARGNEEYVITPLNFWIFKLMCPRNVWFKPNISAAIALSIVMLIFESLAAILLAFKCVLEFRSRSWAVQKSNVFSFLFEQGILYFAIVSIFTTAAVVLNFRAPPGSFFQRLPNAYTLPLSCTLIARFLLQLRKWQLAGTAEEKGTEKAAASALSTFQVRSRRSPVDSTIISEFGNGPRSPGMIDLEQFHDEVEPQAGGSGSH